jgi:hypothetical protein
MDPNDLIPRMQRAGASLLERFPDTPVPTPQQFVSQMQYLDPFVAILVLGAGLVVLLQGWRIFRVWVIVTAAMVGVVAGDRIGQLLQAQYAYAQPACAIGCGMLLALLAWPLMKHALGLIGALTGGLIGHTLLRYLAAALDRPDILQYAWVGAIGGAVILGISAFFLFRMVVIITSSIQGSVMMVSGIVAVLLKYPPTAKPLAESLEGSSHVLPVLMAVPALLGALFQLCWTAPHRPAPVHEHDEE